MENHTKDSRGQAAEDLQTTQPIGAKLPESIEETATSKASNFFTKNSNYILIIIVGVFLLGLIVFAYITSTAENSAVLLEEPVSAESAGNNQNSSQFSSNLLLIILSLLTLVSISISFWLYYWRKLIIADKEIMVPETFESNIQSINKVANNNSLNIQSALDKHTAALNSSSKRSDDVNDEISRISEVIAHLQNAIEKKDEEMERFKKGYDADIYHKFLLRFTRVDQAIKEYIGEGVIDLDGLEDIQLEMEEALKTACNVESFSPEIGKNYKSQDNIEDNPRRIPTSDKNQHEMVAEVIKVGYFRTCDDSSREIISKAKVKIYDFVDQEKNNESDDNTNIDINSLLGIDPDWNETERLDHLKKEFAKWNDKLKSLEEDKDKEKTLKIIDQISKAINENQLTENTKE